MTENLKDLHLYLLGCGKMGKALLKSWLDAGIKPEHIRAKTATKESAALLSGQFGIHASNTASYDGENIVVLAVKPQTITGALTDWDDKANPLYISLAAGIPLLSLQKLLGEEARIIRAMPNTPALVGEGMTALAGSVSSQDKAIAEELFRAAGQILWLNNESQMDAATAIAGSGPAYVFHFAESLMANAVKLGFSEGEASLLVSQTFKGSVALAEQNQWNVEKLRQDVTSKAGVTEAALKILMPTLSPLLERMLEANIIRAKELNLIALHKND